MDAQARTLLAISPHAPGQRDLISAGRNRQQVQAFRDAQRARRTRDFRQTALAVRRAVGFKGAVRPAEQPAEVALAPCA